MNSAQLSTEVLVIGSGPGGALTACLAAEAGRDVTIIEEGPWVDADGCEPFSLDEMRSKHRNGGLNVALGRPAIAYTEGRCVGGGSEVNSGLYHPVPFDLLDEWSRRWDISDCAEHDMRPHVERVETMLGISMLPGPASQMSRVLEDGAQRMRWDVREVPRWFLYDGPEAGHASRGVKQTMSRTLIPRAVTAGARLVSNCRATRLGRKGSRIVNVKCHVASEGGRQALTINADHVIVCAGAVETPALLQRSGIRRNIGRRLKMHPTIKLAARFDHALGGHDDVPVHQVKQFAPDVTLGGSVSRRGFVALALGDSGPVDAGAMADWRSIGVYYAAIRSDGGGRVHALPGTGAPLVRYRLEDSDMSRLARGLVALAELLVAAGATQLYPSIRGAAPVERREDITRLWDEATRASVSVMTIHLFSSVGMGQRRDLCGADSYGRIWDFDNLWVNDASLIPDAPGVNPQGTIMAFASRNCERFLDAA